MTRLRDRFAALAGRLGAAAGDPPAVADSLLAAWGQPARHYHGLEHLADCLARLDEAPGSPAEHDVIAAALWFHDAVYDPRTEDNEERSAAWAMHALRTLGVPSEVCAEVARLVLLTRHDSAPRDAAGRLLCDIDLSILGRPQAEFDQYDRQIRAEYAWVPDEAYRVGRRRVLQAFLERRPLFQTEFFRRRYEAAARANLERAVAALGSAA